jgi:glycosidase
MGNHDRPRLASRIGPEKAAIAAMLLLTLRGTPTLYYGDEIGMRQVAVAQGQARDPARWSTSRAAGNRPGHLRWAGGRQGHRRYDYGVGLRRRDRGATVLNRDKPRYFNLFRLDLGGPRRYIPTTLRQAVSFACSERPPG